MYGSNNILKIRIKHLKIIAALLSAIPFLKCIILNGSLAEGKVKKDSDIDLLIIAKEGRIFTVRFFSNILVFLSGLKKSPDDHKDDNGRFCLNYFLTENSLLVPTGRGEEVDSYCARNYSKSLMVWGKREIYWKFMEENRKNWEKFLDSNIQEMKKGEKLKSYRDELRRKVKEKLPVKNFYYLILIKRIGEKILSRSFGELFEKIVKNIQLKKINSDPRTKKYPRFIVANDKEMRFHPPSPR